MSVCAFFRNLVLLWLVFFSLKGVAQSTISGRISSVGGKDMQGVSVTANPVDGSGLFAFTFSKKDGTYLLKTTVPADSIMITVSKLNFLTQKVRISRGDLNLDFVLIEGANELKEVKVKPPAVRRTGDTLRYSVTEFKSESDRTLGDVLRKLPGIEVDPNGAIRYQGQMINSYYVEGLDLMGGRYGLINENLSLTGVASVEVFENHQPIRILDSLKVSERAALNIRLKKNIVTSYAVHYGVGMKPFLWDTNLTPMLFASKVQMVGSFQSNNTGRNIRTQLFNHLEREDNGGIPSARGWLHIPALNPPIFSTVRWLDNRSAIGSLNTLKKYKSEMELKLNASFSTDNIRQTGNHRLVYDIGQNSIGFSESVSNKFQYNRFMAGLTLHKNVKHSYFKNHFTFEREWNANTGLNDRGDFRYEQGLESNNYYLKNSFHTIFNKGKYTYNLYSDTYVGNDVQDLRVEKVALDSVITPVQTYKNRMFNTHNYVEFNRKIGKLTFAAKAGNLFTYNRLYSQLTGYPEIPLSFNDFKWRRSKAYINAATSLTPKDRGLFFLLELPISHNYFSYSPVAKAKKMHKMIIEPRVFTRWKLTPSTQLVNTLQFQNFLASPRDMFANYIMTHYLHLSRNNTSFSNKNVFTGLVGLNYNNALSIVQGNVSYSYSSMTRNLLEKMDITSDGVQEVKNLDQANRQQTHILNGRISKYFLGSKLTPTFTISYLNTRNERILNDRLGLFKYSSVSPSLSIRYGGWGKADLNYSATLTKIWNLSHASHQYTQTTNLGFYPVRKMYVKVQLEHYRNNMDYLFSDATLRWTPGKASHAIEVSLSNLFNTKTFRSLNLSDLYYGESTCTLRPRQALIRGRINL